MGYRLLFRPKAQKALDSLRRPYGDGIRLVLRALAEAPTSSRFDLRPLKGFPGKPRLLRLRVGEYRVVLHIDHDGHAIFVLFVGHRATAYRGLA